MNDMFIANDLMDARRDYIGMALVALIGNLVFWGCIITLIFVLLNVTGVV